MRFLPIKTTSISNAKLVPLDHYLVKNLRHLEVAVRSAWVQGVSEQFAVQHTIRFASSDACPGYEGTTRRPTKSKPMLETAVAFRLSTRVARLFRRDACELNRTKEATVVQTVAPSMAIPARRKEGVASEVVVIRFRKRVAISSGVRSGTRPPIVCGSCALH